MLRCLSLATALTAFILVVPPAWVQDQKKDEEKPAQKSGVDLDALFKKLDTDSDGKIDLAEFKKLTEMYRLVPITGANAKGNLDAEQLKKLAEQIGGNVDPEQLKKLLDRVGGNKGGLERLKKLKDKLGGGGKLLESEVLQNLIEQLGVQLGGQGGDFDPGQIQELIQNLIGGLGVEKKLREKK